MGRSLLGGITVLGIMDSYGIELLHPVREREKTQHPRIATIGKSNHRWIINYLMEAKFCFLLNQFGLIVCWDTESGKDHDTIFHPMIAHRVRLSMAEFAL